MLLPVLSSATLIIGYATADTNVGSLAKHTWIMVKDDTSQMIIAEYGFGFDSSELESNSSNILRLGQNKGFTGVVTNDDSTRYMGFEFTPIKSESDCKDDNEFFGYMEAIDQFYQSIDGRTYRVIQYNCTWAAKSSLEAANLPVGNIGQVNNFNSTSEVASTIKELKPELKKLKKKFKKLKFKW